MPEIVTTFIHPPIPVRDYDWCAFFAGEEERGEYGYGPTELAAMTDLVTNYWPASTKRYLTETLEPVGDH